MAEESVTRERLALSLMRALWGNVHPQLRQASIEANCNAHRIFVRFEYDGPPDQNVLEDCQCAGTECIADFPSPWTIEEEHLSKPMPEQLNSLDILVYRRAE